MGWVFLILAVITILLAVGYYPLNFCQVFVDFCREAIARFFAFVADFLERGNPLVFLIIAFMVFLAISIYTFKIGATPDRKDQNEGTKVTVTIVDPPPPPVATISVQLLEEITKKPIKHAQIKTGQHIAHPNSMGVVEIPVDDMVLPGAVVKITEPNYVTIFLTKESIVKNKIFYCRKKHRLIVVDWEYPANGLLKELTKSKLRSLRSGMESHFSSCQELILLAEGDRNKIVEELYKIQANRSLYDPETITEVGNFWGATHGVFGEIRKLSSGKIELKGYLVDLATAKMLTSQSVVVPTLALIDDASTYLADLLISHFTEIKVLQPPSGVQCGSSLCVDGYILFRPLLSRVWLSVLPEGHHLHYPQLPITVEKDGRWTAPSVSVGDDRIKVPAVFHIKPILADMRVDKEIEDYLKKVKTDKGASAGMDLTEWERQRKCRIYEGIQVRRSQ